MGVRFDELYEGQEYCKEFQVTEEKGMQFAEVSGDFNPLHLDEEYAKATMFRGKIAHGMLAAGFISGVLGNDFPGEGTVYLDQQLNFVRPVRYGDFITVVVTVERIVKETHRVRLRTVCRNQDGKNVIEGYATVMKKD